MTKAQNGLEASRTAARKHDTAKCAEILCYVNQCVVLDTTSSFLYIGRLREVTDNFIVLEDADVHDSRESPSTKEKYVVDSKKLGVKINRRRVHIRFQEVISLSSLEDVVEY